MMKRAQFAVEMFFAFTFAILLVFWLVNYIESFSQTSKRMALIENQKMIARNLGIIINEVCVNGGFPPDYNRDGLKISVDTPCLQYGSESYYYSLSRPDPPLANRLEIFSNVTSFTSFVDTGCLLKVIANTTRCTAFDKLCIYKVNSTYGAGPVSKPLVEINSGACT